MIQFGTKVAPEEVVTTHLDQSLLLDLPLHQAEEELGEVAEEEAEGVVEVAQGAGVLVLQVLISLISPWSLIIFSHPS